MSKSLYDDLLFKLKEIKEQFSFLSAEPKKRDVIGRICKEFSKDHGPLAGENLFRILNYCVFERKDTIGSLIQLMKRDDLMDSHTIEREKRDDFDGKFGTTTSPIINQFEMPETMTINRALLTAKYTPSPINSVRMALAALQKYNVRYEDFVFIDIGSGLGRNLLLASAHPFKKIIGVEISEYLNEIADKNIRAYLQRVAVYDNFELQSTDALTYSFPCENLVLYFWWPFVEELAIQFVDRLEKICMSRSFRVILVFMSWVYKSVEESSYFKRLGTFVTNDELHYNGKSNFSVIYFSNDLVIS